MTPPRVPPAVLTRLAAAALWSLVAGAFGLGVASFVRLPDPSDLVPPPPPRPATAAAGFAELFVAAFLSGVGDDVSQFVRDDPPTEVAPLEVERTATVRATSPAPGRWWVLVAAVVRDPPPAVDGVSVPAAPRVEHYGVQVAEVEGALTAVAWPALLPGPGPPPRARTFTGPPREPRPEDPLAVTVGGFLSALLTPATDLERWVAPDAAITAVRPAPFAAVALSGLAAVADDAGGQEVLAQVAATRTSGGVQHLQYPLRLVQRDGRWEVAQLLDSLPIREVVSR